MRSKSQKEILQKLEQFCNELHLISGRDTEKTVIQVLSAFMSEPGPLGGSKISEMTGLNRITCIHHIRRLQTIGLVRKHHRYYELTDLREFLTYYRRLVQNRIKLMSELLDEIESLRKN